MAKFQTDESHLSRLQCVADIGVNLTDPMYQGIYNDSAKHEPDLDDVLDRSKTFGMEKLIITGGSLEDSRKALQLARSKGLLLAALIHSLIHLSCQ